MIEADNTGTRNIEDLQRKAQGLSHKAKKFIAEMEGKLFADTLKLLGGLMLGGEKKKTQRPDGSTEESDWTLDDFYQYWEKSRGEEEAEARITMVRDLIRGLEAQKGFVHKTEHPLGELSSTNIDLVASLMERILASDEEISDPYPIGKPTEAYWEAELLEVIRRTVLKPTQLLIEGHARDGIRSVPGYDDQDFWDQREDLITPEMTAAWCAKEDEEYNRLEQERIDRTLETRDEDEWIEVITNEGIFLLGYLRECVARAIRKERRIAEFAAVVTYQDKRLADDETVKQYRQNVEQLKEIQTELADLKEFQAVLPWIK